MMIIENKFEIGVMVFLKTDPEQKERMVVQIAIGGGNNSIRYCLSSGTVETWHYDIEMTEERNVLVQ